MSLLSSFTSLFSKKPTVPQQTGYVNGQPIASFYTPQAATTQPKPLVSPKPITPQITKPLIPSAPKPLAPTVTPQPSTLSSADLLNNTQNAYQAAGLVPASMPVQPTSQSASMPELPKIDYTALNKAIANISTNLAPSQAEIDAQNDYNNLINSRDLGIAEYRNRPVPMGIITGQTQALTEQAATKAQPLKDRLALEQARRQAALDASKFQYEAESDRISRELEQQKQQRAYELQQQQYQQDLSKPVEVNGQLVQRQADGTYTSVFGQPKQPSISDQYGSGTIGEYNFYAAQEKAAGRTPMSFNQYQTMDANRKRSITNINGGTQTDRDRALKTAAVAKARPELERNIGRDGYADPSVYLKLRSDYAVSIGDAAEFDATFSSLLSPFERARLGIGKAAGINADDYQY